MNEHVQTKTLVPLLIEPKKFQSIGFEPVSNHLTPGNIKTRNLLVHRYHNLHV
jgi:hypothetical protein